MTSSRASARSGALCRLTIAGLLAVAPAAFAQVPTQLLSVAFVSVRPAPLSEWLVAGIALLLAAVAMFTLRRRGVRGGRLMGWMLALAAGATLLSVTGYRTLSEAQAGVPPAAAAINLTVSPGTVNVALSWPGDPLTVTVTNTAGMPVVITAITLATTPQQDYTMSTPTTCVVGLSLAPGGTCIITLQGLS